MEPERVDLPPAGRAGSFLRSEYLREDVREAFREPDVLRVRSASAPAPRARHHVAPEREVELLERLDVAGMLEFALDVDVDIQFGERNVPGREVDREGPASA